MSTVLSTTVIAVAVIVAATVAVCFHVIDQTAWLTTIGPAAGVAGLLHATKQQP